MSLRQSPPVSASLQVSHHVVEPNRVVSGLPQRLDLGQVGRVLHDVAQTQGPGEAVKGDAVLFQVGLVDSQALG